MQRLSPPSTFDGCGLVRASALGRSSVRNRPDASRSFTQRAPPISIFGCTDPQVGMARALSGSPSGHLLRFGDAPGGALARGNRTRRLGALAHQVCRRAARADAAAARGRHRFGCRRAWCTPLLGVRRAVHRAHMASRRTSKQRGAPEADRVVTPCADYCGQLLPGCGPMRNEASRNPSSAGKSGTAIPGSAGSASAASSRTCTLARRPAEKDYVT